MNYFKLLLFFFGFFLDLNSLLCQKSDNVIKTHKYITKTLIDKVPKSNDQTNESLTLSIKLINNIMSNSICRIDFIKYNLIIKLVESFNDNKEFNKELSKLLISLGS